MKSLLFDLFILKAYFIQEYVENMNFQDMSEGCQEAVQALAKCNGRERVDHIVAIHINAFTGIVHRSKYHHNSLYLFWLHLNQCHHVPIG